MTTFQLSVKRENGPFIITFVVAILCGLILSGPVFAHKVNVFAYIEGDNIIVEGYFSGGAKSQDSLVEVFDSLGKKILEGKTDAKGIFTFSLKAIPANMRFVKVVVEADMGHRGEYRLNLGEDALTPKTPNANQPEEAGSQRVSTLPGDPTERPASQIIRGDMLEMMDAMMDKKLEPLFKMLGNQERMLLEQQIGRPKAGEIIGGVGWILGLAGIAAFFWSRKKK